LKYKLYNVHCEEMQINADSKGKVALNEITLWVNRCVAEIQFHVFIWQRII